MKQPVGLALLILSVAFSGCVEPGEAVPALSLPGIQVAEAIYSLQASFEGGPSFHGTLTVTIGAPVSVRDMSGNQVNLIPVRHEMVADNVGRTHAWEFLDAHGFRVLVASPCEAMGLGMGPSGCGIGKRVSASFAEQGLPGLLGIGPLQGFPLTGRATILAYTFFGEKHQVSYDVLHSGSCATLQAKDPITESPLDQRFFALAGVARRAIVCADSPFPKEVETSFLALRKLSETAGRPLALDTVTTGAANLFELPAHPRALPLQGGLPPDGNATSGMSLREALDVWKKTDPAVDDFLRSRPDAHLWLSASEPAPPWYVGPARTEQDDLTLWISSGNEALRATVTRKCTTLLGCSFDVTPTEAVTVTPETSTSWQTLPRGDLIERATALVGIPPSDVFFGTAWRDPKGPDLEIPSSYVLRIWAMEPDVFIGVPMRVVLDGRTGLVLQFDAPRETALRVLGLPPDWE